jgi:cyclophilin family peptidyl-prolyl cis-trans isomerase
MKKLLLGFLGIAIISGALLFTDAGSWLATNLVGMPEIAVLHTSKGDIKIKVLPESAPKISMNFIKLAQNGLYNGTSFHRVIKNFMIQGGDYEYGDGTGGKAFDGGYLDDEIDPALSHTRGAVAMANRGPNTNGSQFYIVQKDSQFLDGRYSIFGTVLEGMDTVDKINRVTTDKMDKPLEPIRIDSVTFE